MKLALKPKVSLRLSTALTGHGAVCFDEENAHWSELADWNLLDLKITIASNTSVRNSTPPSLICPYLWHSSADYHNLVLQYTYASEG